MDRNWQSLEQHCPVHPFRFNVEFLGLEAPADQSGPWEHLAFCTSSHVSGLQQGLSSSHSSPGSTISLPHVGVKGCFVGGGEGGGGTHQRAGGRTSKDRYTGGKPQVDIPPSKSVLYREKIAGSETKAIRLNRQPCEMKAGK